ncbi:HAD family hydrolase [Streptomyces sp. NPDC102441]|uniref:HAD family hydrolase n=1 Tax=Streptomyces sp. NPDC102441 TaxID=3366176 RepID=UPI00382998DC
MRCDALSFDLDGTVIDYSVSSMRALEAIGGHRSVLPQWYEVSAGSEAALDRGLLSVEEFEHDRIRRFHEACYGRHLSGSELSDLVAVRRSTVLESVRLFPDAVRMLRSIEALGIRCVAVSNSFAGLRDDIVDRLGLAKYFSYVQFCGDGAHRKPDGEAFSEGLRVLGLPAARVVHIGDEFDADVMGARNAGLQGVHINRSGVVCSHAGVCVPSLDVPLERHADGFAVRFGPDSAAEESGPARSPAGAASPTS